MKKQNLVICDRDFRYANSLGEYIMRRRELAVRIHTCSNMEQVMIFVEKQPIHILLVDELYDQATRQTIGAEKIFVLTKGTCRDLSETEQEIFKFQSADAILAEIFASCCMSGQPKILRETGRKQPKLIAVYSPIHRIGKTTFAVAYAKECTKAGATLYLNLETYSGTGARFARAEGKNLADILYYMRQESSVFGMRMAAVIQKMGELDYVPPFLFSSDLKEVSEGEWHQLLDAILEQTIYENVVLDLSESVQGLISILERCDVIYLPVLEEDYALAKLSQFEEELECQQAEEILRKANRFTVPNDMESYARKISREEELL